MEQIKVKYKEPKGYFSPEMLKAAKEYDKKKAAEEKQAKKDSSKKK